MAKAHFAEWRGEIPNETPNGMIDSDPSKDGLQLDGVVVHIMGASYTAADNWFHNPKAQASAHFGVRKDGHIAQWVDTHDKAWAEMAGNPRNLSIEFESEGEQLTDAQILAGGKILAWAHHHHGVALRVENEDPNGHGLKHHSLGGEAWGNHPYCPGERVIAQKPEIVTRARQIVDTPRESSPIHPAPEPAPKPATRRTRPVPSWYHRELAHPAPRRDPGRLHNGFQAGHDVVVVQRKVGADVDGAYGEETAKRVKGYQKKRGLEPDGVVGPKTAAKMGEEK